MGYDRYIGFWYPQIMVQFTPLAWGFGYACCWLTEHSGPLTSEVRVFSGRRFKLALRIGPLAVALYLGIQWRQK
jgi:hypothetical protein